MLNQFLVKSRQNRDQQTIGHPCQHDDFTSEKSKAQLTNGT